MQSYELFVDFWYLCRRYQYHDEEKVFDSDNHTSGISGLCLHRSLGMYVGAPMYFSEDYGVELSILR